MSYKSLILEIIGKERTKKVVLEKQLKEQSKLLKKCQEAKKSKKVFLEGKYSLLLYRVVEASRQLKKLRKRLRISCRVKGVENRVLY